MHVSVRIIEDANKCPNIIKDILHIEFVHLENLNIWGNNIVSIECLTRIKMPQLRTLALCTAYINV